MKLEQNDASLLFSSTNLPDIFFTEYLSSASGDFVKVYLYLIFLSKYNKEIKVNDISKTLSLDYKTVVSACNYWEELGVITKKTTGFIVNQLQEIELQKLYKPKVSISAKDLEKNAKNEYRAKAIETINSLYFQGMMAPSWYNDINIWFSTYEFNEQVMLALFDYCFNKSSLNKNYMKAVAEAWGKNNIKTFTDLDKYYQEQEKMNLIKKSISKKLGFRRPLSQFEEEYINKWINEFGYNMDIINIALQKTTSKSNPSFDYINKLLSDWHSNGLKQVDEIQKFLEKYAPSKPSFSSTSIEKKSKFNSYDQRQYSDLDSIYQNFKK